MSGAESYYGAGAAFAPAATIAAAGRDHVELTFARVLELVVCIVAVLALAPLLVGLFVAVRLQDGGPGLFGHKRIGHNGRYFKCLKFRSMAVDSAERLAELLERDEAARMEWQATHKLRHDPRITPVGDFLRRTSLDELPQLFNVIRGDMSLVGPRPIVDGEVSKYGRYFRYYCSVRPGITGLWQVSGRNDTTYRRRVALDVMYARSRSIALDTWILCATVPAVLLSRGAR